jgi:hypothetical protein
MIFQLAVVAFSAILLASLAGVQGQVAPQAVAIDNDDIGGVVVGPRGPEAGVWVIAETRDTPTRLIKSVVTDDRGPLPSPRSSESQLRRVGPRIRARGFGESESSAG